ncbi:hypothetical protein H2201_002288 [Coniosporium apollinis]|uniref:Heterokaryon incompatibility Het-C n=1 Tax=Coniosporium apollinis TaxID=61459 RepID=A0ABQ9P1F4_9PEZI|nr:hypothetical protein H2201_002288 [Coniosporium apollinis]
MPSFKYLILLCVVLLVLLPSPAAAFGAGNIASISKVEGHNWRHGDIEDMLKTVACLRGHKWTSTMIKRVYFGNWLRDYSQAIDVGTLKGVQAGTIRILVWVLAFMSFGYATGEFEVTDERLGVYRPEEHIDNPKDYADNIDARKYDPRLRPPVQREELAVDLRMKNYIANEYGGWATSAGYIKHSFARAIHFGRLYTHGNNRGREEDLCEALRCLGQGLHCLEDFGAHTNYTELALRELGFTNVFPHTGVSTQINLRGKHVFPLVTGTFGGVDFLHSVLGEATDHFTQSEIDEVNTALGDASAQSHRSSGGSNGASGLVDLLSKIPGTGGLCQEAMNLQAASDAQAASTSGTRTRGFGEDSYSSTRAPGAMSSFTAPPGSVGGPPGPGIPGMNPNFDPQATVAKIYPILEFRDKVVRAISNVVSKIPGLESLIEKITERLTIFVLSLLAPFIQPIINAASQQLKQGSSSIIEASGKHQYEPWTDPYCTDPTHSLLSKDHFSNILNEPAGQVAAAILQYVAPRIIYAWDHPDVPVDQVLNDVARVFHHPAIRDPSCEVHRNMFAVIERWVHSGAHRRYDLNSILGSESVRAGKNHQGGGPDTGHGHGSHGHGAHGAHAGAHSTTGQPKTSGSPFDLLGKIAGGNLPFNLPGAGKRDVDDGQTSTFQSNPYTQQSSYNPAPSSGSYPQTFDTSYSQQQPYQQQGSNLSPGMSGGVGGISDQDMYTYPSAYQQGYERPYEYVQEPSPAPGQQFGQVQPPAAEQPYGQQDYQGYGGPPGQQGWFGTGNGRSGYWKDSA